MPWRCRIGLHTPVEEEWREIPDYPWIVRKAIVCEKCEMIFDIEEP